MSTPAQIKVNRANSQLSTGPKTQEGKAKVGRREAEQYAEERANELRAARLAA
ncbi:MAG TPA: hypothetical protein VKX25_01715 [Bryobacteraceae bacterium]|jgi:hypothetical protein|nr:hypothetical protein [Bryobacteraceae bacterium]